MRWSKSMTRAQLLRQIGQALSDISVRTSHHAVQNAQGRIAY